MMDAQNFCYWLKGFFELLDAGPKRPEKLVLTAEQVEMIERHLKYVFAEKVVQTAPQFRTSDSALRAQLGPLGMSGGTTLGHSIC